MWDRLKGILPYVEKPARYVGYEVNSVVKEADEVKVRFALAFPDVYEIGSSYMGFQILYEVINGIPWAQAERVFAPWPDMEAQLRKNKIPLYGLESKTGLGQFDLIGFTLQYELGYTNLINMLDLAGLSPLARERQGLPLVVAGGPGALNPEPLADFVDVFFLGEGEEGVLTLAELTARAKEEGWSKEGLLQALAGTEGFYVPAYFRPVYDELGVFTAMEALGPYSFPQKRILRDFAAYPAPSRPVVPLVQPVHDRVSLEICRGCARGCRFCQAGMLYRPVRERPLAKLVEQGKKLLANTGSAEISLSSLSSADHSEIQGLVEALMSADTSVSLPSLRVDSYSVELARLTRALRKTGLTLAPEAGSQRLRNVINKNVSEEDILEAARAAFAGGWDSLKLYFMLGLPGETLADIQEIVRLVWDLDRLYRETPGKRGPLHLTVAVSTFVPKAHTPFQWAPLLDKAEVEKRQRLLLQSLRPPKFKVQTTDWEESKLEALLARGGRKIGKALALAWQKGCRFDAWTEHFRPDLWDQAFAEAGIEVEKSLAALSREAALPWDHIGTGVSKEFLAREMDLAHKEAATPDCTLARCSDCGVCPAFGHTPFTREKKTCD